MAAVEGRKAPAFKLPATTGSKLSPKDYADQILVLYFYSKDGTGGCTTEAQEFQRVLPKLERLGATVVGVSKDSLESHDKFAKKHGLKFPLVADPDKKAISAYGVWGEKNMYGKKVEGVIRSTFVIAPGGTIARVFSKVRVKGHADRVVEAVRELAKG